MKNNELKEKVLNNVVENIAISNITKELEDERKLNRPLFYKTISACAAVVIVGVIFINGNMTKKENSSMAQNVKDEIIVGKHESENIQLNKDYSQTQNGIAGMMKDPTSDSALAETSKDNYRGEYKNEFDSIPNKEMINDELKGSIIYNENEKVDGATIVQKIIKNILEIISSIF